MMKYQSGYKYQLLESYTVTVKITPPTEVFCPYLYLSDGELVIESGYAWDGPSGPTIDTKNFMRGSLVHDALYQLMRLGALSISWRRYADDELYRMCREDGMSAIRAWYVYRAVRRLGYLAVAEGAKKKVLIAP